jgi:hypothetical protein
MSTPAPQDQRPPRAGGTGRPIRFLIAAILGLGGLGVATGMALGSVGSAGSGSPAPASADYDCPGRGGYGGGFGGGPGPGFGPE